MVKKSVVEPFPLKAFLQMEHLYWRDTSYWVNWGTKNYTITVGNPGPGLGLPWALAWHRCSIGTNEPFWRGPDAVALGGLSSEYQ